MAGRFEFTDGTFTLRNYYTYKRKNDGITIIKHNYKTYKIVPIDANNFTFEEVTKEEKIKFNIKDEDIIIADVKDEEPVFTGTYNPNAVHMEYETIKTLVKANIPVYLHGPAGSGKNFTIKKIAKELGLEFYFVNSVQDYFKITGFIDGNGRFHETEFYKAFTKGGLFFLDEIDASIPEVLVLLNAAIANKYFSFPTGQVDAHPDFRVIAAGNTVGSGADEMYTGRMVIDMSSIDRFSVLEFNYDKNVELSIAEGNNELVNFIHECRRVAKDNGIRIVFSYRALEMVTALEKTNLDLKKILKIAVFKGMDIDSINVFQTWSDNKYSKALKAIQRG